jgi:hypothetical protein
MKPVVAFLITFAVGTAASTGAKVMTAKPVAVHADSTTHADSAATADSTHGDTAVVASGEPVHAPADTMPRPTAPRDADKHVAAPDAKSPAPGATKPPAAPAHAAVESTVPDSVIQASERRVAKVFTAMDAKQAAKVLEHMADGDVQIILGYVGPRQAASIMAELPPARVARLSKRAMTGGTGR